MNMHTKYINNLIMEVCLDARIGSGIIDLNNLLHREIIAEHLLDDGVDVTTVVGIVNELAIRDGKYPDRQAYNKEGWLVTFPSPEYKNAAIKKGTHFASDPTHGKGGMNIYYKRKGKQKRMAQQDPSAVEPSAQQGQQNNPPPQEPAQAPQAPAQAPAQQAPTPPKNDAPQSGGDSSLSKSDSESSDAPTDAEGSEDETPESAKSYQKGPSDQAGKQGQPAQQAPQAPAAPTPPPAPSFVHVSVEFAKSKQWNPTPYGEWRNAMGEASAVVGLSGEVVPVKSTDREELKLFAAKKQPNA